MDDQYLREIDNPLKSFYDPKLPLAVWFLPVKSPLYMTKNLSGGQLWHWPVNLLSLKCFFLIRKKKVFYRELLRVERGLESALSLSNQWTLRILLVGTSGMCPCSKNTYKAKNESSYNYFEWFKICHRHIEHALNIYIQCIEYIVESDK